MFYLLFEMNLLRERFIAYDGLCSQWKTYITLYGIIHIYTFCSLFKCVSDARTLGAAGPVIYTSNTRTQTGTVQSFSLCIWLLVVRVERAYVRRIHQSSKQIMRFHTRSGGFRRAKNRRPIKAKQCEFRRTTWTCVRTRLISTFQKLMNSIFFW